MASPRLVSHAEYMVGGSDDDEFKCCLSILRSLHMAMKELQDFPKIPRKINELDTTEL